MTTDNTAPEGENAAITEDDVLLAREFVHDINNPMANYAGDVERAAQKIANYRAAACQRAVDNAREDYVRDAIEKEGAELTAIKADNARLREKIADEEERRRSLPCVTEKYVGNIIADLKAQLASKEADNVRLREFLEAALRTRTHERDELAAWKESAMSVMPDYQELGRLLKMPLGSDCSAQLVPSIAKLIKEREEAERDRDRFMLGMEMLLNTKEPNAEDIEWANKTIQDHAARRARVDGK